ncbi:MAG: M20/M25/M40 family metallo-hydrolase [Planctomycetota bacterium]|nr:M20/M25/M40 family metallo-hydrolase [Planctomycetota bacterium]
MRKDMIDSQKAFGYMKSLSFERRSGSPEEKRAALLIAGHLRKMGLKPQVERFDVDVFSFEDAVFEVTTPYKKRYKVWPVGYTKSTPKEGIAAPLVYIDNPNPGTFADVRGKIVLMEGGFTSKTYQAFVENKAKGFVRISAPDRLVYGKLSHILPKRFGRVPGVTLGYEDGLEIVSRGASYGRLISKTSTRKGASQNVTVEIKGKKLPNEVVVICAHYDSVVWSPGATDNAAGSALALALAEHFTKSPLARTLRFIWFGCEEIGLIGSFKYTEKHKKELKKVKMVLNLDVGGTLIGRINAIITGDEKLANYIEVLGKETGAFSSIVADVYSSDSVPFAEYGVPSVNLYRGGGGTSYIHTDGDSLRHCGPSAFETIGRVSLEFLRRVAEAVEFPFTHGLPVSIQEKLKKYIENSGRFYKYKGEKTEK